VVKKWEVFGKWVLFEKWKMENGKWDLLESGEMNVSPID
jgi:hypothetical protein